MYPLKLQEKEIAALEEEIKQIKDGVIPEDMVTPELEKLKTENAKLKYQIKHLKRVGTGNFVILLNFVMYLKESIKAGTISIFQN